jgi:hypothetical protein
MNSKPHAGPAQEALPTDIAAPNGEQVMRGRRALLRAGAGSAPVLLTLASGPVSATQTCVVASSFVSVATFKSRNPTATSIMCTSGGGIVQACMANAAANGTVAPYSELVSARLGVTTSPYGSQTICQVLTCTSLVPYTDGDLGVLQHLLCMSIALQSGAVPMPGNMSNAYLASIWQNLCANMGARYSPSPDISWTPAQVVSWLRMCMEPSAI